MKPLDAIAVLYRAQREEKIELLYHVASNRSRNINLNLAAEFYGRGGAIPLLCWNAE